MCDQCYGYEDEDYDPKVDFTTPSIYGELSNEFGSLFLTTLPGSVYISEFRVLDEHQGKGHGRRLMQTVIDKCSERGFDLTLEVYSDNTPALRLYESLGFAVTNTTHSKARWGLEGKRGPDDKPLIPARDVLMMHRPCRTLVAA